MGSLLGCLVEFKFNEKFSLISGFYDTWITNKYIVKGTVGQAYGGGYPCLICLEGKSFPLIFRYSFNLPKPIKPYLQLGIFYDIPNKWTLANYDTNIWTWPFKDKYIGIAKMNNYIIAKNSFSIIFGVGLIRSFYNTHDFNISLDIGIGVNEIMNSTVVHMRTDDSIWYKDMIGNKGDFVGLSLGYSIPVLKKALTYKTDRAPVEILKPVRKPKKQLLPDGYTPRLFFHSFGGFSVPFSYSKSPLNDLNLKTSSQYGGYYGANAEIFIFKNFSLSSGYINAYHATGYKIYYSAFKPFFKSKSGQYKNVVSITVKYYSNPVNKSGFTVFTGINYNTMYNNSSHGGIRAGTLIDTTKNYDIRYWRETTKNKFINLSFGSGIYHKIFKTHLISFNIVFDIGLSEIQYEKFQLEYKNKSYSGEIGTRGSGISCFIDYSIPIFQSKFYLR